MAVVAAVKDAIEIGGMRCVACEATMTAVKAKATARHGPST